MNKKGVDAVVATVLIIMITVSAIAIIWATVIPMIKNSASSATAEKVSLTIETNQGYTVFDPVTNYSFVQIKRGVDNTNLTAINIVFFNGKETKNFTRTDIPSANNMMVYSLYLQNFGTPIKISVSPVFSDGKEGEVVSEISTIISGTITKEQAEARGPVGNIENGCVVPTETNCVSGYCGGKIVICSCTDLQAMSSNLSGNYLLGRNIDCSGISNFVPIGNSINAFNGNFDGGSKVISSITITSNLGYIGLFGYINNSKIKNVGLTNEKIISSTTAGLVGGIAGGATNSSLINSFVSGEVTATTQQVGGLIGTAYLCEINDSYFNGKVNTTGSYVGGITGYLPNSSIYNSSTSGQVIGGGSVGGLVGDTGSSYNASIKKSYSTSSISANSSYSGGLAGRVVFASITESYATGAVNGTGYVGGLIGQTSSSSIIKSYSTGNINSTAPYSGGFIGSATSISITDSYSTGNVYGSRNMGGFMGQASSSNISNTYSIGNVNGTTIIGGFLGYAPGSRVYNSYSTGRVSNYSATTTIGGFLGNNGTVVSLTNLVWYNVSLDSADNCYYPGGNAGCTAIPESTGISYFYNTANVPMNSWDFTNVWQANSGALPTLRL